MMYMFKHILSLSLIHTHIYVYHGAPVHLPADQIPLLVASSRWLALNLAATARAPEKAASHL